MMKNPSHPGKIVRGCLEELNLNVTTGAKALGVTRSALSRLINYKADVSRDMAIRLSQAFGSTVGFWLRLQLNYDLAEIEAHAPKIRVRRIVTPQVTPRRVVTHRQLAL